MTAPKSKPTARDVWEGIDNESFKAEVERVIGMSDAEVEADLIKDGFDPAKLKGAPKTNDASDTRGPPATSGATETGESPGTLETMRPPGTPATGIMNAPDTPAAETKDARDESATETKLAPVRRLPLRTRTAPWLIAATLTFLLVGYVAMGTIGVGHPRPSDTELAATLRKDAKEACAKTQWRSCLDRLNEADRLDPGGADDATVKSLRKQAEEGVGPK